MHEAPDSLMQEAPESLKQLLFDFLSHCIGDCYNQSLELLKNKKRKFLGRCRGMLPRKILKVETKICAI